MNKFDNLKFFIEHRLEKSSIDIFAIERLADADRVVNFDGDSIVVTTLPNQPTPAIKPLLSLPMFFGQTFLNAIHEHVSQQKARSGKPANESLLEGKLLATEKHLEDMREISTKLPDAVISTKTTEK